VEAATIKVVAKATAKAVAKATTKVVVAVVATSSLTVCAHHQTSHKSSTSDVFR
jgi:hypothetical protein